MRCITLLTLFVVLGSLSAQVRTVVSPKQYQTAEAGGGTAVPFGLVSPGPWRHQQLHGDLGGAATVLGVAWRRDGTTTTSYASIRMDIRLDCSTAAVKLNTFTGDYDANHGSDRATVVHGAGGPASFMQISWPATVHSTAPAPFAYGIPFRTPFPFRGGVLVWDMVCKRITSTSGIYLFDRTVTDPAVATLEWTLRLDPMTLETTLMNNHLCLATGQVAHAVPQVKGTLSGTTWTMSLSTYSLPWNSTAFWFVGNTTGRWGPLALPFTLPGTTCDLVTPPLVVGPPVSTGNIGRGTATLQFPHDPSMRGNRLYLQWAALDAGKPQGLMLSRGLVLHFPLATGFPPACAETVWWQRGLVTEFTLR